MITQIKDSAKAASAALSSFMNNHYRYVIVAGVFFYIGSTVMGIALNQKKDNTYPYRSVAYVKADGCKVVSYDGNPNVKPFNAFCLKED